MTAHRCLFANGPIAGQTVLVTGSAGLERIVEAHEAQESGKVMGNIVVEVGKE